MRVPVYADLRELDRGPRRFLAFSVFNLVSWQCIAGAALILFGRTMHMPASWIGLLISFMPLTTVLVVVAGPLIERFGPKRMMLSAWMARNIVACSVFIMPWALHRWGEQAAWFVLLGSTLGFCLMRVFGAAAWLPWLHEVVPEKKRGMYFSTETIVIQSSNVLVSLALALALGRDPGMARHLTVYAAGILAGLVSLSLMARVPGGAPAADGSEAGRGLTPYRIALANRSFRRFVLIAVLCLSSTSWLGASYVLYLREVLGLPSWAIMSLTAVSSISVMLTVRAWGRFADHSGSGLAMFKTLTGHSILAAACLFLVPGAPWTLPMVVVLSASLGSLGGSFWMATNRAMLNQVRSRGRIGYTNIWTVGTAAALGITPILAGVIIDRLGLWGYRTCFLISASAGFLCALACLWAVRDTKRPVASILGAPSPLLPVRTLARIVWITVGMHESNRSEQF